MSAENVEIVRRMCEAYARRDKAIVWTAYPDRESALAAAGADS